jgi:polysaccharide biosynthesis transport protein
MIEGKQMQRLPAEMPFSLKLNDIYYVLFRRKWIILGSVVAGLCAAAAMFLLQKPLFWSEAKLLVRYVIDTKSVEAGMGTQVKSPEQRGETIINSELEILTSIDICEEVARLVGPERILGKAAETNLTAAAIAVYRGLTVENPRRSNIIKIRFMHPYPAMCQAVLRQLIESYFRRHKEIHRAASSYDDLLTQQGQQLLVRIRQNEEELRNLKAKAGVISVEDAKKNLSDQLSAVRQEIFASEAQLAELRIMLAGGHGLGKATEKEVNDAAAPAEKVMEYKSVSARTDSLRAREFELLANFTDENPQVIRIREQIAENDKRKKALETDYPRLALLQVPSLPAAVGVAPGELRPDPLRIPALEAKISALTNQLAAVHRDITTIENLDVAILDVQRKLTLDRQNYMHIAAGVEAARFDEALSAGKMSNIQSVQTPSPAAPNVSQRLKKVVGAFAGLVVLGLGLAFLLEYFVDHTVRRPAEFENKFQMPLFLAVPKLSLNGHANRLPLPILTPDLPAGHEAREQQLKETWAADHPLRPFIDGLRDRTLIHFEGDPKKPKLIGVTSCSRGVGVTSLAAGLAGALSETGDGNVLLLNLNFDDQSVAPFFRGELACGLTDVLEADKRQSGMVLQNLYVATAGAASDPESGNLSRQLARVVPKLRVSDYDYIVFDLPPTTPVTMTARLAGMMDLVVLVVESEKDTQDAVKQAGKLLARSKAPVSAVLNKVNNPVPRWLSRSAEGTLA